MEKENHQTSSNIPIQLSRGCAIASIQVDLTEEVTRLFRSELLDFVKTHQVAGVILDLSGVEIMDVDDFSNLRLTMSMVELLGAQTVLSGLRPGVVSALVELGAETDDIQATLNLDEAFLLMQQLVNKPIDEKNKTDDTAVEPGMDQDNYGA